MRNRTEYSSLHVVLLASLFAIAISVSAGPATPGTRSVMGDQQYAGTWVGTYSSESGGGGSVTFVLNQDEKAQWHGTVKYTTEDGEQTGDLASIQISGAKFKAALEGSDSDTQIVLEGQFDGTRFEGTYTVSEKGTGDVVDRGTWKTSRN